MRTQTFDRNGNLVRSTAWTLDAFAQQIAGMRYQREVSGIAVGGVPISTERGDHRIVMQQLLLVASANSGFTVRLKTSTGFVTLNAAQTIGCCQAMLHYIQSCFAVEDAALQSAASATTDEQFETILNGLQWPAQVY